MKVVGVKLNCAGKTYYFDSTDVAVKLNSTVIVETEKGLQYGQVVSLIPDDCVDNKIDYKKIIRLTTKDDYKKHLKNLKDASKALIKCNELILQYNLDMKVIDACYTFDREQLIFRFLADERVDFRQLAKDLGALFKTRIELRQVGIRDKAKEIGGIGPCGRKLCCNNFLTEFDSVSINMAKNQNLSLNPTKINGVCGRLLCCLKYENENYNEYKKGLPEVGKKIKNDIGEGKVISVDVFKKNYTVLLNSGEVMTVSVEDESKK
ncbi:MAG: stage 0 sporulation family protein [Bacilli bacterium]